MSDPAAIRPLLVEMPFSIKTYDIDFAGIVSNIVYVRWLEDLRLKMLENVYPLEKVLQDGALPVLARTEIEYRIPLILPDRPLGRMWVTGIGRARFELQAEFTRDGEIAAAARQKGYFVDVRTHLTTPVPAELRKILAEAGL